MTIYDVIAFLEQRKAGTKFSRWTPYQLGCYIKENTDRGTIRVASDGTKILGILVFNPSLRGKFWIEQVWGERKVAMKIFVEQLMKEYPEVTEVWGHRHGNREVKFSLKALRSIYGR